MRVHIPGSEYAHAIAESNHSWILLSEEREDRMGWCLTLSPWEYVDVSALDPEYTKEYPVTETHCQRAVAALGKMTVSCYELKVIGSKAKLTL